MSICLNLRTLLLNFVITLTMLSLSHEARQNLDSPVRAVSLGGWLVTEGWIKPSLFDGIPNKDFLDGTGLQFKSVTTGKYLCAESGGGTILVANRTAASGWETFRLWRLNETTFRFRVFNKQFVGLDGINAKSEVMVSADISKVSGWRDDDPTVFQLTIGGRMQGEFQVTNGYGPLKAPQVMKDHWNSFIVENDLKMIASKGINALRIPVGWWIASDPTPPSPYVAGSLHALDNAFFWAQKYGLKIIIDLHAAPGSQNGYEHSSSRDTSQEWGKTDENIQQTVNVIEFLAARYAKSPSLYAVELINEPLSPGATLEALNKYYKAGYEAVRKHSKTAYVVLSNRLASSDPREFFPVATGLMKTVIDVHYYSLYESKFDNLTVQQNIDFIQTNRSSDLTFVTTSNGPLTFVGEWVSEWKVNGATKEDYQRFAKAQLDVYGRATFGWSYWTLKNVNNHWSLEWMINNGYIKL
ncbi:probable glucan 1,3-beta-glucosidase A isoform X2 [Arachis hypogaea]|uniref:probable glucan 1,3-beta-glucosidase A isoform X2 n=1 Tax=Arachis hypogaea TaxID=3818 RepID=UPI000DEC5F58|nr:probable glucan 1,3-beta-glucosidase A isoform X2 [Arachis hypogaea]